MFSVPTYSLMQQSFLRQMQVNGERHNCDVCEKSFSSVYSLGRHKQMFHVQGKTNCCRECGKSFFNSYLLKRHLLSHSSDRPFICPVCGKTYKYKHDLKNHCLAHANWGHPACCVINFCKTLLCLILAKMWWLWMVSFILLTMRFIELPRTS